MRRYRADTLGGRGSPEAHALVWAAAVAALISASSTVPAQVYPDLDLEASCPKQIVDPEGGLLTFGSDITLRSAPNGADASLSVQAWSLSLRPTGGARVLSVTTDGTTVPVDFRAQGYEKTELTQGAGNEGAVSAVLLSLSETTQLPLSGEWLILRLELECTVPEVGSGECGVRFSDGLVGSGQPIKNVITCGHMTRKDDGGDWDNDADGYGDCSARVSRSYPFIRGDLDGDAEVSLTDPLAILGALFQGEAAPPCEEAADLDLDGLVSLSDAIYILDYLFRGGPAPPTPYPACGWSPERSELTCSEPTSCL